MLSTPQNELLCRVGPGTMMGEYLRRFWIPVLQASDLPEPECDAVELRILGEDLLAFRDASGQVGLLQALCPHRQAPLYYARNEEHGLRCVYHGWKFDVTGKCVDMPNEPASSNFKDKLPSIGYLTREWAGLIWAYMGPKDSVPELPQLEWAVIPENQRYAVKYVQESNFVQALEGDLDSSHIGFLHKDLETFRNPPSREQSYTNTDKAPVWLIQPTDYGMALAARRDAEEDSYYWRINQFFFPFYSFFAGASDGKRGHGHIWVPVDDEHTVVWDLRWAPKEPLTEEEVRNVLGGPRPQVATLNPKTGRLDASQENHFLQDKQLQRTTTFSGIRGVREQDTAMQVGMGRIVDRTREHLGTSDTAIIAMRRLLLRGAEALAKGTEPAAASNGAVYRSRAWSAVLKRQESTEFFEQPEVRRLSTSLA